MVLEDCTPELKQHIKASIDAFAIGFPNTTYNRGVSDFEDKGQCDEIHQAFKPYLGYKCEFAEGVDVVGGNVDVVGGDVDMVDGLFCLAGRDEWR